MIEEWPLELNSTSNFAQEHLNVRKDGTIDGRINNRGCSNRTTYSYQDKWNHIEKFEMRFDKKKNWGTCNSNIIHF